MENKNLKYPIVKYDGGCMYIEPLKVDNQFVYGTTWQVRVTKEITGILEERGPGMDGVMEEFKIPVGVYPFLRYNEEDNCDDVLLYDLVNRRFIFKRFVEDSSGYYAGMMMSHVFINPNDPESRSRDWKVPVCLRGFVRCYTHFIEYDGSNGYRMSSCDASFIDISKLYSPREYIYSGDLCYLYQAYPSEKRPVTLYFPAGEYCGSIQTVNGFDATRTVTISGDGSDKTIIRQTDRDLNDIPPVWNFSENVIFKDIKIFNHHFLQYDRWQNETYAPAILEFHNVQLEYTFDIESSHLILLYHKKLKFKFIDSSIIAKKVYMGIFIRGPKEYLIENSYFKADQWSHPIRIESSDGGIIRGCKVINGVTGIFHAASKDNPIVNSIVENCELDGQTEESIAFDSFGNEVGRNPFICECSVIKEEQITGGVSGNKLLRLKVGKLRRVEGGHPTEYYVVDKPEDLMSFDEHGQEVRNTSQLTDPSGKTNAEWFGANLDYLTQFYVVFNVNAGKGYTGTFAKIQRVEQILEMEGQNKKLNTYIIIERPSNIVLSEGGHNEPVPSLNLGLNEYTVTVSSGFFFCKVLNNRVKNNPLNGISLWAASYGCVVNGNTVANCGGVLFSGAHLLAKGVNNGFYGNIITDNILMDVKRSNGNGGLMFKTEYYDSKTGILNVYNNVLTDNLLINSDLIVQHTKGCAIDGNNVQNGNLVIENSQTTSFGDASNRPVSAIPGQTYYNQTAQQLEMWTGTVWIVK